MRLVEAVTISSPNGQNTVQYELSAHINNGFRRFVFHIFCWEALLESIGLPCNGELDGKQLHDWLFQLVDYLAWLRASEPLPDHGYYGGADLREPSSGRKFLRSNPTLDFTPALATYLSRRKDDEESLLPGPLHRRLENPPRYSDDTFSRLPSEILLHILSFLPSADVCSPPPSILFRRY